MFVECCVLCRSRSKRRADHSSRLGLPTVVCHCVCGSRNVGNDDALAPWGWGGGCRAKRKKEGKEYAAFQHWTNDNGW